MLWAASANCAQLWTYLLVVVGEVVRQQLWGSLWKMVVVEEEAMVPCWCHQIDCQCLLRLVWEGEVETVSYRISSTYLRTAAWPSGYIAASMHVTPVKAMVQFLLMYFFLYYNSNKGKHWNLLDSNTFQRIPMETIPGGSRIPTDSTGIRRILL